MLPLIALSASLRHSALGQKAKAQLKINIRQLEAFLLVADELHFRRAAERLAISQPTLTRHIRDLEGVIGAQLFTRNTRQVQLTDAGRLFRQESSGGLKQLVRAVEVTRKVATGKSGFLTVGVQDFFLMGKFSQVMSSFQTLCPDVTCAIHDLASERHAETLLSGAIDVGFPIKVQLPSEVNSVTIDRQRVVALVHRNSQFATLSSLRLECLSHQPLIMWEEAMGRPFLKVLDEHFHARRIEPTVAHRFQSTTGMIGLVSAGMGIGIHAESIEHHLSAEVCCLPIRDPDIYIDTMMIWKKGPLHPACRQLIDLVRRQGPPPLSPDLGSHP